MTSPAQMVYQRRENTRKTQSRLVLVLFTDWLEKQQVCFHWFKRIQILAKLKGSRVFLVRVVQKVIENILSKTCSTLYCKKRFEAPIHKSPSRRIAVLFTESSLLARVGVLAG